MATGVDHVLPRSLLIAPTMLLPVGAPAALLVKLVQATARRPEFVAPAKSFTEIEFLSGAVCVFGDWNTTTGADQVAPVSVERLTTTAVSPNPLSIEPSVFRYKSPCGPAAATGS